MSSATALASATSTTCGVGLQPFNVGNFSLPATYNGCNPNSATRFSACHVTAAGVAVCNSCGKCGSTACTSDAQCGTNEKCIINSACASAGKAVCLNVMDTCYGTLGKRDPAPGAAALDGGAHGSYDAALY